MEKQRILVIEDDLHLLNLFTTILQAEGFRVDRAATMHAAQLLLSRQEYMVCISDMQLGYNTGISLLAQLAELKKKGLRVIVISGRDDMRPICEAADIEFYDKPIANEKLVELIRRK